MYTSQREPIFDFDRLFNTRFQPARTDNQTASNLNPRVDIYQTATGYELIAELPGVSKDHISVAVEDNILTIKTNEKPQDGEQESKQTLRKERATGNYMRSFNLGKDIDSEAIEANFRDGLLILSVPTLKEGVKQRLIEIH